MFETLQKPNSKAWLVFLTAAILLGAILRLSFPGDIEYKGDEKYMFDATQDYRATGNMPLLGMKSGIKLRNPGMSIWVFDALSRISGATTPPELARSVQVLNILALVLLAFFSLRLVSEAERLPWLWAAALAAVNPFAVLFHRKIWAQCTLPFFCVLFWIAWHYRGKKTGAFFWGLLGACLGQIHMSGFFFAAAVFAWTLYRERRLQWGSWLTGSLLGAIPLIPWLRYVLTVPPEGTGTMSFWWTFYPKYWAYWVSDPLGMGLTYSLKTKTFLDFIRYPLVGEIGTYLVALLHVVIVGTGLLMVVSWLKNRRGSSKTPDPPETWIALTAVLVVTGILMSLSRVELFRHYLIVTFPLEWVWLAWLGLWDKRWGHRYLMVLWIAQLLLTASFLLFLHLNHGDVLGDYGVGYQFQMEGH